ncbi:SAM-dependent methyltransferase [Streptomyces iconiensis]|uniref:SAM-dependent methyltransferase n=1 Tax=Streptomyces iconiensis TaxID=1384038 RepID=A0ABT6ZV09_9ACTN|nr:SAM-dependent methyltransferase [Streptomyces iconiensis]MDJ1132884.1 SAM-dependent methyltransferase [Streptomyces iconiensis]
MTDSTGQQHPPKIDTTVPHSARIWNYLLGGKDHYDVDRAAGDKVCEVFPGMVDITRHSRAFTGRVVRYLAGEAGIDQFLDIGTGLPTVDNTHELAQRMNPAARIVYVDNDPLVLAHAEALLTSTPEGVTSYLHADVRDPEGIVAAAGEPLELGRPVGLMLMGILGLVDDYEQARAVTARLLDALPAGSYLALNDGSTTDPAYLEAIARFNSGSGAVPYTPRTPGEIEGFFEGLELLEPGVVSCPRWRPEALPFGEPPQIAVHGGLARKP